MSVDFDPNRSSLPDTAPSVLTEWLRRHVVELSSIQPDAPLDDLEPLRDLVGDAAVVALGEGAHFIDEFWTVRCRLMRFLHERLGFDTVAAEFDLGEGELLEAWLADPRDPRPLRDVSRGAADWGMASTAHWMRSWRARTAPKLRFVGLDAPNGGVAFREMLAWVSRVLLEVDPDCGGVLDGIEPIADSLAGTSVARSAQAWAALGEARQDALTAGLARLHQRVRFLDALLVERSDRRRVDGVRRRLEALACADYALRANEAMHRGTGALLDLSGRDRLMADSVLAILAREPKARIMLLAHNGHIQKRPVVWGDYLSAHPLGLYLHEALGDGYRAIGTTTTGSCTSEMKLDPAREVGFEVVEARLEAPQEGSLEAALVGAAFGDRLTLTPVRRAAASGFVFQRIRAQSGYLTSDVGSAYDGIMSLPHLTVQRDLGF